MWFCVVVVFLDIKEYVLDIEFEFVWCICMLKLLIISYLDSIVDIDEDSNVVKVEI